MLDFSVICNINSFLCQLHVAKSEFDITKSEEEGIIACRTRSKLSLNDTPLDEIEASFIAPDITPDLYDESTLFGDDGEWQTFLVALQKTEGFYLFVCF